MNDYLQLLAMSGISVAVSFAVLRALSAPLLLVLVVSMFARFSDPLGSVRLALVAALAGLLIGLLSVGRRMAPFVKPSSS